MKRLLIIFAIMTCGTSMSWAQDTVRYGDSTSRYLCGPPIVPLYPNQGILYGYGESTDDAAIRCVSSLDSFYSNYWGYVVDEPTMIYGVAATSTSAILLQETSSTTDTGQFEYEAYAMLIQKEGGDYYHIDSARMYNHPPNRYYVYPQCNSARPDVGDTVVWAYEFYFREPVVVVDTIFVGTRFTYIECPPEESRRTAFSRTGGIGGNCLAQLAIAEFIDGFCCEGTRIALGHYFPIIVPPDTDSFECPRVENFHLSGYVDGHPKFRWEVQAGQGPFQIAYGPADQPMDSHRVATAVRQPYVLPDGGLDTTVLYVARCRGRCHHTCPLHDTIFWSEWSDAVEFWTGSRRPGSEGIASLDGTMAFTLSPNPARGRVTVAVGGAVTAPCVVVLRDEQGRELLRQRLEKGRGEAATTELSTRGLPAGVYLVTLESPQGSSTQKLVVER